MTNPQLVSQSFLGPDSDERLASIEVGIVGLGGGGSHVAQQLAHVGVGKFVLVDFDRIEHKNLNRLVGGTLQDVTDERLKVEIAERVIKSVNPTAVVEARPHKWQEELQRLRRCSAIVGCVDTYGQRDELEKFCRRFLIHYIDLGMDVFKTETGYGISGQTVLSSPGGPCLRCLGIVTDERIRREAEGYGAAGSRPQVVWINGVLASLGVGILVQLVCPWHDALVISACCEYDGNRHLVESNRLGHLEGVQCRHYRDNELGDPFFSLSEVAG